MQGYCHLKLESCSSPTYKRCKSLFGAAGRIVQRRSRRIGSLQYRRTAHSNTAHNSSDPTERRSLKGRPDRLMTPWIRRKCCRCLTDSRCSSERPSNLGIVQDYSSSSLRIQCWAAMSPSRSCSRSQPRLRFGIDRPSKPRKPKPQMLKHKIQENTASRGRVQSLPDSIPNCS